jgi:aquaporin NIP
MNPARSLGPAIATSSYKGIWVYMVGPITGALLGAWSYVVIQETNHKQDNATSQSPLSIKLQNDMTGIEL